MIIMQYNIINDFVNQTNICEQNNFYQIKNSRIVYSSNNKNKCIKTSNNQMCSIYEYHD